MNDFLPGILLVACVVTIIEAMIWIGKRWR
jgi:hypothetical protein